MPQRSQRRRVKGWRMPEGAVYVGRGSKWGNPFRVYQCRCCPVRRWDIIAEWGNLVNPRPLTPAEYAEHGIPQPCDHVADEETVKRAMRAFYANAVVFRSAAMRAALIAAGFKAAE